MYYTVGRFEIAAVGHYAVLPHIRVSVSIIDLSYCGNPTGTKQCQQVS